MTATETSPTAQKPEARPPAADRSPEPNEGAAEAGERPGEGGDFSERDRDSMQDRQRLRTPMIYEILRKEGDEEMERPLASLWWSGVAAGLSISFSLLTEGMLRLRLPDAPWRPLVEDLGYSVGFLMVVLARQQLFTENTITVVLPAMAEPTAKNLRRLGRMWAIVLTANLAGTLFAALFCCFTPVLSPEIRGAMWQIASEAMAHGPLDTFFRAISAGFLIAAMVWLIPSAEGSEFWVITLMTYLIALGGFAHIIAGSFEAFMVVIGGRLGFSTAALDFALPALAGNVVGGTALFALIAHAQVAKEL